MTAPDPATAPSRRRPFGQRTNRVLFLGMLVGLLLVLGAVATNSDFLLLGLPLVLAGAGALFAGPAVTLVLPAFRSRTAAERVALRIPAVLSGIGVAGIGVLLAQAATGAGGFAAGLALAAAGGWAVAQAIALPRAAAPGGVGRVVADSGMVVAAALFAALALGAVPKMAGTKEKAYIAEMKSDLRNLVTAEEAYFADSTRYTTNLGTLYYVSSGVVGPTIALTATGWTAKVGQTSTIFTCAIFVGNTPLAPATIEGNPACDNIRPPFAGHALLVVGLAIAVGAGVALSRLTPPTA